MSERMGTERRRSPRIQIYGKLHGHLVALDVPVTVTEISLGGLGLETSIEFPVGAVHEFSLTLGDESSVLLKGRVMHTRRISTDPPRFVVGVQFIDEPEDSSGPVGEIIEHIK